MDKLKISQNKTTVDVITHYIENEQNEQIAFAQSYFAIQTLESKNDAPLIFGNRTTFR